MRKAGALLLLFFLSFSCWAQDAPDGYVLVPIETLRSWEHELTTGKARLSASAASLTDTSEDTQNLRTRIETLQNDITTWQGKYQDLLKDSEKWATDFSELNRELLTLKTEYERVVAELTQLLKEYDSITRRLGRTRAAAITGWTAAGVMAAVLVIVIAVN